MPKFIPPKSILVRGKLWSVRLVKVPCPDDPATPGVCITKEHKILIQKDLGSEEMKTVFWHEVGHAILSESMLVGHDSGLSELAEEIVCDCFADYLSSIEIKLPVTPNRSRRKKKCQRKNTETLK